MDQDSLYSTVAGEHLGWPYNCCYLCLATEQHDAHLQIWGVLLGIGNETYTKGWHYVGPGIAVWEVPALFPLSIAFCNHCSGQPLQLPIYASAHPMRHMIMCRNTGDLNCTV